MDIVSKINGFIRYLIQNNLIFPSCAKCLYWQQWHYDYLCQLSRTKVGVVSQLGKNKCEVAFEFLYF